MSYEHPAEYLELESTYIENLINVNIVSLNVMTRIILPQMIERKKGAIINISSLSAAFPTPLLTVYAGSKSYVDLFSQGLCREYGPKGVTIQCIMPGETQIVIQDNIFLQSCNFRACGVQYEQNQAIEHQCSHSRYLCQIRFGKAWC